MSVTIDLLKNKKIGVLMGGWSSEREISLRSGENIYQSLKRQGFNVVKIDVQPHFPEQIIKAKIDIAFIALHGRPGEDGTIQGFLELLGIPYTGSKVTGSVIGMDKLITKRLLMGAKIPTPRFIFFSQRDTIPSNKTIWNLLKKAGISLPVIIKPRKEGSSVGCVIVDHYSKLAPEAQKIQRQYGDILIEEFLAGAIATVGILGNKVLPILELVPKHSLFYDYKAKYTKGETEFIIPARFSKKLTQKISELALRAFKVLDAYGFARLDLIVYKNRPYFLEINTIPGMTEISDLPAQAKSAGISYDELVLEILKSALD
ncbi:MAG: D-alanine--D-alanine ligase [candidate division WOR-3 bacterium]|nr:D-alanine--D-alanine ligase [candidate division WOR-3 bacterium]MDW7987587.1 D-alanine--D-alanine ligase [candidate division WOR-3 bacterium]